MTSNDIIVMALEAGLKVGTNISGVCLVGSPAEIGLAHLDIDELARFAALVAAAEREECAKVCEESDIVQFQHCMTLHDDAALTLRNAAADIRARGQE